jgi:hypothetical protein
VLLQLVRDPWLPHPNLSRKVPGTSTKSMAIQLQCSRQHCSNSQSQETQPTALHPLPHAVRTQTNGDYNPSTALVREYPPRTDTPHNPAWPLLVSGLRGHHITATSTVYPDHRPAWVGPPPQHTTSSSHCRPPYSTVQVYQCATADHSQRLLWLYYWLLVSLTGIAPVRITGVALAT